ncbi:TIM21-domain-containing protein [Cristinia sonorae]|uniref:Mitochondrial import inner membrane translocase subunit Tim21 n=1 Tax=Cristinia sonorae TaxID=1940300 RepID=A0A8K0UN53_9AGAR|nr:TIM21-domain-containing protein [Cristinia sonorae]
MNIINARIRIPCCNQFSRIPIKPNCRGVHFHAVKIKVPNPVGWRTFATHRDPTTTSSLLSNALDQKQRAARREDNVGPFQLGLIPPTPRDDVKVKKWSELSTSGKVLRSTARTSNAIVIVFGAGLFAVLVYALTSEMFSPNSPTVLYGKACDLIKASPRVAKYLQGPLSFHNNPSTGIRPRHRNHHLSSQIAVDSQGREHMLLNFYVKGQPPGSTSTAEDESYLDSAVRWTKDTRDALSKGTLDELAVSARERVEQVLDRCKHLFKFLSGDSVLPRDVPPAAPEVKEAKKESDWLSGLTGVFSGIKGPTAAHSEHFEDPVTGPTDTDGEVHADLVMNDQGYFEFRYILIDIPDSHARNPKRVFVVRTDGVRETERVMRWHK